MKFTKSILCLTLFVAFSSAYAGSKYLNGSPDITKNGWTETILLQAFIGMKMIKGKP